MMGAPFQLRAEAAVCCLVAPGNHLVQAPDFRVALLREIDVAVFIQSTQRRHTQSSHVPVECYNTIVVRSIRPVWMKFASGKGSSAPFFS